MKDHFDNYIVNYIKENLNKGHGRKQIEEILIDHGYSHVEVHEAFEYVKGGHKSPHKHARKKSKNKKSLPLITIILIVVIGLSIFLFIGLPSKTISESEFSQGTNFNLEENKNKVFIFEGEEHIVSIESVYSTSVDLIIRSDPVRINIRVGDEKKLDLNGDGFYDMLIRLDSIVNGIPELYIKEIHESIIDSDDIVLDIVLPKESYSVGEEVSGDYYLKYQGEPFKGAVIYCDNSGCSKTTGMIEDIDFNNPDKTNYLKVALADIFYSKGTYDYSIYIYDCEDIDDVLNTEDCGGGIRTPIDEIIEKVTPLKSKSKSITVSGENEEYVPECTNNDDCTQTCTNCEDGAYVCVYSSNPSINQKCVECVNDFGCVDGYECVSNICVIEEQDEPEENQTPLVTDPNTILDCYSEDLSEILCSPEDAIGFTNLFENRLGLCEISQGTFALGFEPFLGIFRGYDIQNEQGDNCIVKFWFLENSVIDSSLLNKEMVCEYDSSKRTAQGVNGCFEECCSGELVDAVNEI